MKVLFICSTNFVRSPLASALFAQRVQSHGLANHFTVTSAGVFAGKTERQLDKRTIQFASSKGIDLSRQGTNELTLELARSSDIIPILDEDSRVFLESQFDAEIYSKAILIPPMVSLGLLSIPDPVLGEDSFEECFRLLEIGVEELFRKLQRAM